MAILLIYLLLGLSYWNPERALHHLSLSLHLSLSHLTTTPGEKPCLIWIFLKNFLLYLWETNFDKKKLLGKLLNLSLEDTIICTITSEKWMFPSGLR